MSYVLYVPLSKKELLENYNKLVRGNAIAMKLQKIAKATGMPEHLVMAIGALQQCENLREDALMKDLLKAPTLQIERKFAAVGDIISIDEKITLKPA